MTADYNRQDIVDLRNRVNKLEDQVARNIVKMSVVTALIALTIPSLITIAPIFFN